MTTTTNNARECMLPYCYIVQIIVIMTMKDVCKKKHINNAYSF